MFLTDQNVLDYVASLLKKKDSASLPPQWSTISNAAHSKAYRYIIRTLTNKGYTLDQVTSWDDGADYERQLSGWYALILGGALDQFDERFLEQIDVREEIGKMQSITSGGVILIPAGTAGQPQTGAFDTSTDIFQVPGQVNPPEDFPGPGLGRDTVW